MAPWRSGTPILVCLITTLVAVGYDLAALLAANANVPSTTPGCPTTRGRSMNLQTCQPWPQRTKSGARGLSRRARTDACRCSTCSASRVSKALLLSRGLAACAARASPRIERGRVLCSATKRVAQRCVRIAIGVKSVSRSAGAKTNHPHTQNV